MLVLERVRAGLIRLEGGLYKLEQRLSLWGVACLLATVCMALGALYVRPAVEPVSHGVYYAELSRAPFSPGDSPVAYRILTPLLAYLVGLRGNGILVVNLALAWLTLVVVYRYYRAHNRRPLLALVYVALLATSMPTLFTIHVNGYTDAASYLLLFLLYAYGGNPFLFGALFFFSLLNRESVAFMLPFLLLLQVKRANGTTAASTLARSTLAVLVATAAYVGARYWLGLHATGQQSASYYLAPLLRDPLHWLRMASKAYYLGVFSAFKLYWLLPLAAMALCVRRRRLLDLALLGSAIVGALAQTVIAVDISRMLCMAYPAVLLGLELLEGDILRLKLEPLLYALIVVDLLTPQLYIAGNAVYIMQTLVGHMLTR